MPLTTYFARCLAAAAAAFALAFLPVQAGTLPGPVVDAHWLHAHLSEVTVIDVLNAPKRFTAHPRFGEHGKTLRAVGGHIPGARLMPFSKVRVTRTIDGHKISGMLPSAAQFQTVMREAGINAGKPIVISCAGEDVGNLDMATRLYWTLKSYGAQDVALLNGGTAAWIQGGYKVSSEAATTDRGNWTAANTDLQWFADSDAVAKATTAGTQLVDARSTPQFLGITKKSTVSEYGHIKGARSFPTDAIVNYTGDAAHFMTAAQYNKIFPQLGIKAHTPTITYCNTGHLASGAWFVMHEIMGNKQVRLYDGSMLDWTTEGRAVVP